MRRSSLLSVWGLKCQALGVFFICVTTVFAQQSSGTLRGRVADEFGGLIVGATVTVADQNGIVAATARRCVATSLLLRCIEACESAVH